MGGSFRICQSSSAEEIRQKLTGFGRFSEINIRAEIGEKNHVQYLVFSEIDIGERLRRFFFEDKKKIENDRKQSQKHLKDLSLRQPDIKRLLGVSILDHKFWTTRDLRQKLKMQTTIIHRDPQTDKFEIKKDAGLKCGVTDAKLSEVAADTYIHWNFFGPTKSESIANYSGVNLSETGSENAMSFSTHAFEKNDKKKSLTITCNYLPDEKNLRDAYRAALKNAKGHVVLSPIYDVPTSEIIEKYPDHMRSSIFDVQSDRNLRILLEEADRALTENENISQVTISRGDVPDKWFLSRVLAQRAILERENNSVSVCDEKTGLAMPESLRNFFQAENAGIYVKSEVNESTHLIPTRLSQVRLSCADPGVLMADTTILSFESVHRCAAALAKSGLNEFRQIRDLLFDQSNLVYDEASKIITDTEMKWGVRALALPSGEIPCDRLYAIQPGTENSMAPEAAKNFFIQCLRDLHGRTVIEIPAHPILRQALWSALVEINSDSSKNNANYVLAALDSDDVERFLQECSDLDQRNENFYSLDIDGDEEHEKFDYIENLKNKIRR